MGRNRDRTADNERHARLVDKDGVHLVHNAEHVTALHLLLLARRHAVVAEVVEPELRVHPVANVAVILRAALVGILVVLDDADREAEEFVQLAHPFTVASCEVIVRRHAMRAASGEAVKEQRERGHERLSFARSHFRNHALGETDAANDLRVEMHHVPRHRLAAHGERVLALVEPPCAVFHRSESLGNQCSHIRHLLGPRFIREFRLPACDFRPQFIVAQRAILEFQFIDLRDGGAQAFDHTRVFVAEEFFEKPADHYLEKYLKVIQLRCVPGIIVPL